MKMVQSAFKLTDQLYESGKQKNHGFIDKIGFIDKYDNSISRNRIVLSLTNKYSFLNLSDFYFTHTQKVLFEHQNDMLSDVLFSVFILINSFDLDQALDRYKYNLIKNIHFGYISIESCYSQILNFHSVDEDTRKIFSFNRSSNNDLEISYKGKIINYKELVINYLSTLNSQENRKLLNNLKKVTTQFLDVLFSNNTNNRSNKIKEIKSLSTNQIISKVSKNKIDIRQLYQDEKELYIEAFKKCLKYIRFSDDLSFDSSFFANEESKDKITNYKKKYQSEYFLETSLMLFFNNDNEINALKLKLGEQSDAFSQLIKFKKQNYINP